MLKEGTTTITATTVDGGLHGTMELTVTPALNRASNQKMNLDDLAKDAPARIDVNDHLGWPETVGDYKIALWSGDKTMAYTATTDDSHSEDFNKWNAWNKGLTDEQMEQLRQDGINGTSGVKGFDTTKYETAYGVPTTFFVPIQNYVPGQSTGKTYATNRWAEQVAAGQSVQSHSKYHIDGDVKNSTFTSALHARGYARFERKN